MGRTRGAFTAKSTKRKAPYRRSQQSPPPKRRAPSRESSIQDDQPDLHLWLSQSTQHEPSPISPPHTIIVEAEIHPEPKATTACNSNIIDYDIIESDPIDIALGIAKDAATVKSDIKRVEQLIQNNRNVHASEHDSLLLLLNTIFDNVQKIDNKAECLEEKVRILTKTVNGHEVGLKNVQQDIRQLFNTVASLESRPTAHAHVPASNRDTPMDVEDTTSSHSLIISNLPNRDRDEEDVSALLYLGLCMPVEEIQMNKISRSESKTDKPGNITVQFESLEQKIKVLSRKRELQHTNEYHNVYIRTVKSHSEVIMERNFANILKTLPGRHNLVLASNGKIVKKHVHDNNLNFD